MDARRLDGILRYDQEHHRWTGENAAIRVEVAERTFSSQKYRVLQEWGIIPEDASEDQQLTALYVCNQVVFWKYRREPGIFRFLKEHPYEQ